MAKVIIHPEYTIKKVANKEVDLAINDIMLLKLQNPVALNQWVAPVCLPDMLVLRVKRIMFFKQRNKISPSSSLTELFGEPGHDSLNHGMATVVGWGKTYTDVDEEISIVPTSSQQKLVLPVISTEECINKFKEYKETYNLTNVIRYVSIKVPNC